MNAIDPKLVAPLLYKFSKFYGAMCNSMLQLQKKDTSKIREFVFKKDEDEVGIQAADLISHLMFSEIRRGLGISTKSSEIKHELLTEAIPGLKIDDQVLSEFTMVDGDAELKKSNINFKFYMTPAKRP